MARVCARLALHKSTHRISETPPFFTLEKMVGEGEQRKKKIKPMKLGNNEQSVNEGLLFPTAKVKNRHMSEDREVFAFLWF